RTPHHNAHHGSVAVGTTVQGIPVLARQVGSSSQDSEELIAYEAGYRYEPSEEVSFDLSTFYNEYPNLIGDSRGSAYMTTNDRFGTHFVLPFVVSNNADGD